MIGTTVSHYKIIEKLGEGGMGVVYKALDTKLDRTVALKFLPPQASASQETKDRFLQEAKAAAALNHNNICTIHGVEEHEGSMFIVMEYIEGGTLRQKLPYAKTDDALNIALQIGEALQEAHAKGIVHRDIKSDNVMLTSKGQAKVMDFGLAKLKGSLKLTRTSSTVGTLAYMAPEQVQGGEVDSRSDIFSFGVLLFEMLTGKTPFRGEHEAAMVYSIVNEEPESLQRFVPDAPPELMHILRVALEKDPSDRYQTAAELTNELRRLLKQSSRISRAQHSSTYRVQPPTPTTIEPLQTRSNKMMWIGIASVATLAIVASLFLFVFKPSRQLNPNMSFRTISMPYTDFMYPGLTQDGNWIVFPAADANGKWDLYWMHKSGGEARRVTFDSSFAPPARFLGADISPDGSQITYNRIAQAGGSPSLFVVSSNGGVGRKIASLALAARWNTDGSRIGYITFYTQFRSIGVSSVKPDGTDERVEFVDSLGAPGNISLAWSPDGESIAWIRGFKNGTAELITHNLKTKKELQLTFDGKQLDELFWTKQNTIVYSSTKSGNTNLWSIPAEGGEAVQITKGGGPDLGMKLSTDGNTLLYYQNQTLGNVWLTDNQATNLRQITFDDKSITSVSLSPDGRSIAFAMNESDEGYSVSEFHLYVMDRDGNNRRQLTFGNENVRTPQFSPDGAHIAYATRAIAEPDDSLKIKVIPVNGSGPAVTLRAGSVCLWINESELSVVSGMATYRVPRTGGASTKMAEDSIFVFPFEKSKLNVFGDIRQRTAGMWIGMPGSKSARRIFPLTPNLLLDGSSRLGYYFEKDGALWQISLLDGKKEHLRGTLPGVNNVNRLSIGSGGKEIAFVRRQSRGKLVMIENLLK